MLPDIGAFVGYGFKGIVGLVGFALRPTLEIKQTALGGLDQERTRLMLLVWMRFRNNAQRPFILRAVEVELAGEWLKPVETVSEHFRCLTEKGWHVQGLNRTDNVVASPQIPPSNVVERFAVFSLPVDIARTQNGVFNFAVRVKFPLRFGRRGSFVIRNKL